MRLLIQGNVMNATIDPRQEKPTLVLDYERSPVEPDFAHLHGFEIVDATPAERLALRRGGYRLPDHAGQCMAM